MIYNINSLQGNLQDLFWTQVFLDLYVQIVFSVLPVFMCMASQGAFASYLKV